jgi:hypothetical protein
VNGPWRDPTTRPKEPKAEYLVYDSFGGIWLVENLDSSTLYPKDNGCGCCSSAIYDIEGWMPLPDVPIAASH